VLGGGKCVVIICNSFLICYRIKMESQGNKSCQNNDAQKPMKRFSSWINLNVRDLLSVCLFAAELKKTKAEGQKGHAAFSMIFFFSVVRASSEL
jgi:hypothetical protein